MRCTVYRSASRAYTYLYLRDGLEFDDIPDALRTMLGPTEKVMDLELTQDRSLAQEDPEVVRQNLAGQGWHLQLPPTEDPSGWLELPPRKEN